MDLRLFIRLLEYDGLVAEAERDVEFRALHRHVDPVPAPETVPAAKAERLTLVRRLSKSVALLGVIGREG